MAKNKKRILSLLRFLRSRLESLTFEAWMCALLCGCKIELAVMSSGYLGRSTVTRNCNLFAFSYKHLIVAKGVDLE